MASEYRVRWRRDGSSRASAIFQTRAAAEQKARGILALEDVKAETTLAEMADLVEQPYIEAREVGDWGYLMPAPAATDDARDGMRMHFGRGKVGPNYGPF